MLVVHLYHSGSSRPAFEGDYYSQWIDPNHPSERWYGARVAPRNAAMATTTA